MHRNQKIAIMFKITPIFIFCFVLIPILSLFLMEVYLNKVEKDNFRSSKENFANKEVNILEKGSFDKDLIISDKIVRFRIDSDVSNEVWSRESYFIESLRAGDYNLSNFHENYLSDFYGYNNDNLFLENKGMTEVKVDSFKIKANTLPLDRTKKSILVIGDSFVAGQNSIDENRIFYKIFADKIKDLHKDNYFNIISAGRNGWGFYDYVLNASNIVENIDIDYLVVGFLPNDSRNTAIAILRGNHGGNLGNDGLHYINCINGREWLSKLFLKSYIYFPKSSRVIIMRYCDKYLKVSGGDILLDNEKSIGIFKESLLNLKNFSKKNGFEVIFMPLNPMENSGIIRDDSLYELISDAGFDIIPSKNSDLIVKEKNKSGWVNPIDWHPSVGLSYAYAMDMYQYFLDRFKIEDNGDNSKKDFIYGKGYEMLNYISSIKPKDLNFIFSSNEIRLDNISKDMLFTTKGYYQFLGIAENEKFKDKIYPPQSALCAKINRAHIELAFNQGFINYNNSFTVKNNHKDNSIIVAPKGYSSSGEDLYSEGYLLLPGEYVSLKNQGNLIVASEKVGCAVEEEIKLPELDISIKVS